MTEIGLNVFQVIQNELISREGSRSNLGVGFRLAGLEERLINAEAVARNGKVWRPHHAVSPLSAVTPASRERVEAKRRHLLERKGAKKVIDEQDPTMNTRSEERWEIHTAFPRTVLDFKELQFHLASLLDFYNVKAHRPDFRLIDIHPDDRGRDVSANIDLCLEELAMQWGLDWQKIGGLAVQPPPAPSLSSYLDPSSSFASGSFSPPPVPQQGVPRRATIPVYFPPPAPR